MEHRSGRNSAALIAAIVGILVLSCATILWFAPTGFVPHMELARSTWESQRLHHYELTIRWTYGSIVNGPWTLEVRDERVVGGADTRTGRPLTRSELLLAQQNMIVGVLFNNLADEIRPSIANTPRTMLARTVAVLSPNIRDLIDRCAPRLPSVEYHPTLGYPTGITAHGSPCYRASEWTILVLELHPLP
jgi:hypothetical protein